MSRVLKFILVIICASHEVSCGLLSDFKLNSRPLSIKNHHAPIQININSDKLKPFPPLSLPKPAKPPPSTDLLKPSLFSKSLLPKVPSLPKLSKSSLFKPRLFSPFSPLSKLAPPIIPPILPPFIPGLPLLPLLPPIIPPLPLLPLVPRLPRVPRVPSLNFLKPLKVPILRKSPLQKALGSELSPVTVKLADVKKDTILKKLKDLQKKGSLTTAEFERFRRLLVE